MGDAVIDTLAQLCAPRHTKQTVDLPLGGTSTLVVRHRGDWPADAAIDTDLTAGQALLDTAVLRLVNAELTPVDAAKVKLFCTELQGCVVDRCLQLFGGYGYVTEYPIARLYADARVTRIYGGTSEVMKSIISKSLRL